VKSEYEKKKLVEEIGVLTRMREKSELRVDTEVGALYPHLIFLDRLCPNLSWADPKVSTLREAEEGSNGRSPSLVSEVPPV
jgi:hypothetical protein